MSTEASEHPIITKHSSELKADVYASTPAIELVICAVQILQADASSLTAEEIVSTCFRLFPHRFSLKNYFYWPDSAHVVQTLKYAKEKGYLKETPADGFILRPAGRQLARQAAKAMGIRLPMPPKVEKPMVEVRTVDDRPQTVEEKPKTVDSGPQTVEQAKEKVAKKVVAKPTKETTQKAVTAKKKREKNQPAAKKEVVATVKAETAPKPQKKVKETPKKPAPIAKPAVKKEAPKKITAKKAAPKPVAKKEAKQPVAKVAAKPIQKKAAKKQTVAKPVVKKEAPKIIPQTPAAKKPTPKPAPTKKELPKVVVAEKPKVKKETPKPTAKQEAPKATVKKAAAATQLSLLPQVSPKEEAKKAPPAKKEAKKQVPPKAEVKPAPVIQKEVVSKEEKAKAGKVVTMVERSDAYRQYKKLGAKATISEFDFRNMLFATMESSAETLKRNLDLFKRYAGFYNRADLITFFEFCERGFAAMLQPSAKKKR